MQPLVMACLAQVEWAATASRRRMQGVPSTVLHMMLPINMRSRHTATSADTWLAGRMITTGSLMDGPALVSHPHPSSLAKGANPGIGNKHSKVSLSLLASSLVSPASPALLAAELAAAPSVPLHRASALSGSSDRQLTPSSHAHQPHPTLLNPPCHRTPEPRPRQQDHLPSPRQRASYHTGSQTMLSAPGQPDPQDPRYAWTRPWDLARPKTPLHHQGRPLDQVPHPPGKASARVCMGLACRLGT